MTTSTTRTHDFALPIVRLERHQSIDSLSVCSFGSAMTTTTDGRVKRTIADLQSDTDLDVEEGTPVLKIATASRGKKRDPGNSAGMKHSSADGKISTASPVLAKPLARVKKLMPEMDYEGFPQDIECLDPERLRALTAYKVAVIFDVCRISGNIKGTCIKDLKNAARTLQEVNSTALTRTVESETLCLRRTTRKLREEIDELKAENEALRASAKAPPSVPAPQLQPNPPNQLSSNLQQELGDLIVGHMEKMERSLRLSLGEAMTARLEAIEDRLLPTKVVRPPLSKKTAVPKSAKVKCAGPGLEESIITLYSKESSVDRSPPVEKQIMPPPPVPAPSTSNDAEGWSTVARRRQNKKNISDETSTTVKKSTAGKTAAPALAERARKPKDKKRPRLPQSAAVVITLQPEAVASGLTYAEALLKIRDEISLADLGIEKPSVRITATGSRAIELPGACSVEQADNLAKRAREVLGDVACITRPVKRMHIRVIELDESITKNEVIARVATEGGCKPELIRAGEIRPFGRGSGAIHLSLPVAAARALVEATRLQIGLSTARIRLLQQGPLRCYKCLDVGHTRPVCPSAVDRGVLCFRCGLPGHKALQCTSGKLHCALCADAGRPAEHQMGATKCRPPLKKGRVPPPAPVRPP